MLKSHNAFLLLDSNPDLGRGFFIKQRFYIHNCLAPAIVHLCTAKHDATKNNLITCTYTFL